MSYSVRADGTAHPCALRGVASQRPFGDSLAYVLEFLWAFLFGARVDQAGGEWSGSRALEGAQRRRSKEPVKT